MSQERHESTYRMSLPANPSRAIIRLSGRLENSLHRSLQRAEASGLSHARIESDYDEILFCLVYLTATVQHPIDKSAVQSLRKFVRFAVTSRRFSWIDLMGPQIALELATERCSTGMDHLYANLNHHNSSIRNYVVNLAWLTRSRLSPTKAAERIMFNVGASHAYAAKGLAVLRGMCPDDPRFWHAVESVRPDFERSSTYGMGLEASRPEERDNALAKALDDLRDPGSELARYVRNPPDLWEFERSVGVSAVAFAAEVPTQLPLWP